MEKGDTDFATVVRTRTTLNAINPTLVRFYWQEMLESVGEIHDKSMAYYQLYFITRNFIQVLFFYFTRCYPHGPEAGKFPAGQRRPEAHRLWHCYVHPGRHDFHYERQPVRNLQLHGAGSHQVCLSRWYQPRVQGEKILLKYFKLVFFPFTC